jgi:hypothetical protein
MNTLNASTQQPAFDVFYRESTCQIYSLAIIFDGASEPVALCNFENLATLQSKYSDMVLISENEANLRIAKNASDIQQREVTAIETASQKIRQETGHKFTRIDAGRS